MSIPRNYNKSVSFKSTFAHTNRLTHIHSDFLLHSREKESERVSIRISSSLVVCLCAAEGARLPSEQLEFKPYLCLAGPRLTTVDELPLGTGLQDKHCCLCSALLNNSISLVLRLAMSWLAPTNLTQFSAVHLYQDSFLHNNSAAIQSALFP